MITDDAIFLVIDDDDFFRNRLSRAIKGRGYAVYETGNPGDAIEIARKVHPSHVVLDLRMPGKSGLAVLKELRDLSLDTLILILTGYGSIATALEAVRSGAVNYLPKPADLDQILAAFTPQTAETQLLKAVPSLSRVEWEHIERVMRECDGNVSKAAKMLKIHRRSLQRKLKNPPVA